MSEANQRRLYDPVAKLEQALATMRSDAPPKGALWEAWTYGFSLKKPTDTPEEFPLVAVRAQTLFRLAAGRVRTLPRVNERLHLAWEGPCRALVIWPNMRDSWQTYVERTREEAFVFSLQNAVHSVEELSSTWLPSSEESSELVATAESLRHSLGQESAALSDGVRTILCEVLDNLLEALSWEEVTGSGPVVIASRRALAEVILIHGTTIAKGGSDSSSILSEVARLSWKIFASYQVVHDALEAGDTVARLKALLPSSFLD